MASSGTGGEHSRDGLDELMEAVRHAEYWRAQDDTGEARRHWHEARARVVLLERLARERLAPIASTGSTGLLDSRRVPASVAPTLRQGEGWTDLYRRRTQ
jgi:hypothetical protein